MIRAVLPLLCLVCVGSTASAIDVTCDDGGAIPGDGIDDRAALQAALNTGCLRLEAGTYDVATPPAPRPVAMLRMPPGARIYGVGPASIVAFRGDVGGRDWIGILLADRTAISRVKLTGGGLAPGSTNEQSAVIAGYGPLSNVALDHITVDHPVVPGSRRGDNVHLVCYEPKPDGTGDKRCNDIDIGHLESISAARSGVAIYGGCHRVRIHDSAFHDTKSQDFDGEGLGGCTELEIDHNTFETGPDQASALAVSLQNTRTAHLHDNTYNGRGLQLYGCSDCEVDHERMTQQIPIAGGVIEVDKTSSGVRIHDVSVIRGSAAGANNVVRVWQREASAPDHVSIKDSTFIQHAAANVISTVGVDGVLLDHVTAFIDAPGWYALDALGSAGAYAQRTTGIQVTDSQFYGPFAAVVRVSGSYGGTGSVAMERVAAPDAAVGLHCENMAVGAGVIGPVTYADVALPTQCGGLIAP